MIWYMATIWERVELRACYEDIVIYRVFQNFKNGVCLVPILFRQHIAVTVRWYCACWPLIERRIRHSVCMQERCGVCSHGRIAVWNVMWKQNINTPSPRGRIPADSRKVHQLSQPSDLWPIFGFDSISWAFTTAVSAYTSRALNVGPFVMHPMAESSLAKHNNDSIQEVSRHAQGALPCQQPCSCLIHTLLVDLRFSADSWFPPMHAPFLPYIHLISNTAPTSENAAGWGSCPCSCQNGPFVRSALPGESDTAEAARKCGKWRVNSSSFCFQKSIQKIAFIRQNSNMRPPRLPWTSRRSESDQSPVSNACNVYPKQRGCGSNMKPG